MGEVNFVAAVLYGIVVENVLYGFYLTMFGATMYALFMPLPSGRRSVNYVLLSTSALLFISLTIHFVVNCGRLYGAFIIHGAEVNGPAIYLSDMTNPLMLIWASCYIFEAYLNDALTIYRLYVIWGNNLIVCIPPFITITGMLITGIGILVSFARMTGGDLWSNVAATWMLCCFVCGLATNILACALIGYRVLRRDRALKAVGAGSLKNVLVVIVESAAIYSVVKFTNLILLVVHSNMSWAFLSLANPFIGIASHLIILRVSYLRHIRANPNTSSGPPRDGTYPGYPMRVQVTTDRMADVDIEGSDDALNSVSKGSVPPLPVKQDMSW